MREKLTMEPLRIENGRGRYEPVECPATIEAIRRELEKQEMRDAVAVFWLVHRIRFGRWEADAFHFADEEPLDALYLVELRVFDAAGELHLRREGDRLRGRFRCDGAGVEEISYVDTFSRFWGEREDAGDWMHLRDRERKLCLTLPSIPERARYVGLVTRSYIEVHGKTGQAGYADQRYLALAPTERKGEEAHGE